MGEVIRKVLILCGIGLLAFAALSLAQEGPSAQMKATIDKVLDILKDPTLKSPEMEETRRERLRKVIFARFDFTEMARRSLGLHWRRRTPKEREEFIDLFADLLERSYRTKIERYTDEEILYTREKMDDRYGVVNTKIISRKENVEVPIDYKVIRHNSEWKVYDVVIDGISLVNNYRSQFNRIIRTSSFAELMRKMRIKQEAEALSSAATPNK